MDASGLIVIEDRAVAESYLTCAEFDAGAILRRPASEGVDVLLQRVEVQTGPTVRAGAVWTIPA